VPTSTGSVLDEVQWPLDRSVDRVNAMQLFETELMRHTEELASRCEYVPFATRTVVWYHEMSPLTSVMVRLYQTQGDP